MKQGWEIKKLGDVYDVYDVRDGTHDSPKYVKEGYALITSKNLKNDNLNYDNVNYITEQDYISINKRSKVDIGDILFAMIGTIGNPIVIKDEPDFAIKNVALFKVPTTQDSYFLKYYLDSGLVIEQMIRDAKGATQKFVGLGYLRAFEIPLPPIQEQQRIVAILDEAFAAIAQAKANAEQNLKNAKELFESYLQSVFENKGEGWEEKTVENLIKEGAIYKPLDGNHGEIHPLKDDYVDKGIPFIMSRDMKNGIVDEDNCKFISEEQARSLRTGFSVRGDVLLSHKGTIGSVAILETNNEFVILTPQITYYRIKNKDKFYNRFLYYYFLSPAFQKAINGIAQGGSTRAYIGITKQLNLSIVIAPLKEQQDIVQKLDALSTETKQLEAIYQQKINDLDELKKSILQKAFAGELH